MLLALNGVTVSYPGTGNVLDNIDLLIGKGEFICIAGKAGSGKTTLLETIGGLHKPDHGTILFTGRNIYDRQFDRLNFRRKLQIVSQFPENQFFETCVRDEIAFGLKMLKTPENEKEQRIMEALQAVGFDESILGFSPFALSGGQKRLLALACVLVIRPEILLLDEPFSGLDSESTDRLLGTLRLEHEKGMTILMVSHDPQMICETAGRLIVLKSGRVFMDGSPSCIYADEERCRQASIGLPDTKIAADLIGISSLPDLTYTTFINKLEEKILGRAV